jgi:hypothetical protein
MINLNLNLKILTAKLFHLYYRRVKVIFLALALRLVELNEVPLTPNKKFMRMFIGFFDGDGYFDIGEQKQYNKQN